MAKKPEESPIFTGDPILHPEVSDIRLVLDGDGNIIRSEVLEGGVNSPTHDFAYDYRLYGGFGDSY